MSFLAVFVQAGELIINLNDCSKILFKVVNSHLEGELSFYMIRHYLEAYGSSEVIKVAGNAEVFKNLLHGLQLGLDLIKLKG